MTLAGRILSFNQSLKITTPLPEGVEVLTPFLNPDTRRYCTLFYKKYYNDSQPRTLLLGINPGRFGAGLTGIPFTDPVKLEKNCGIKNPLPKRAELSADFIYRMIGSFGGAEKFYHRFYISAISPLGFMKDGKNLNYYDMRELQEAVTDFITDSLQKQLRFGLNPEVCFCLGEGKNYGFLSKLNSRHGFFRDIIPLPHPRYIMQYRRKQSRKFIDLYIRKLTEV